MKVIYFTQMWLHSKWSSHELKFWNNLLSISGGTFQVAAIQLCSKS